ncbi:MAG: 23S rRNA (pseudouridine(1915)-N(3))-methyltransferase RlmH [Myxococcales bacterium]|nr:23S rRNA (pseudouridine(1915)-N(3))-methyltransferase RlmH [Myxococcales bacterium]
MRLRILAIGKLKDARLEQLCDEYVKRSRPLVPIERVACRSAAEQWKRAEEGDGPVVVLDERGAQIDTVTLSGWIGDWRDAGRARVDFLVGDAHGYDDPQRARADRVLALSRLTLPHRLAQLLLCEQLYRAGTILAGHPYHHA